jgi:hypothetical protein
MALHTSDEYLLRLNNTMQLDKRPELELRVRIASCQQHELVAATLKEAVILSVTPPRELEDIDDAIPQGYRIDDILLDRRLEAIRVLQKPLKDQLKLVSKSPLFSRLHGKNRYSIPESVSTTERKAEILTYSLQEMDSLARAVFSATRQDLIHILSGKRA